MLEWRYMEYVTYDEFKKLDIRIGTIREIEPVEGTDKLLRCQIDFGIKKPVIDVVPEADSVLTEDELAKLDIAAASEPERDMRQIISGIREFYPNYEELIGKQVLYVVNLEPREIKGHTSHGMLMAVDGMNGQPVFLVPDEPVAPGSKVR
ncbi:MAG: metG [Patescibacteria group bacterium]|nr:metG [Patescibacteria group bacterium]